MCRCRRRLRRPPTPSLSPTRPIHRRRPRRRPPPRRRRARPRRCAPPTVEEQIAADYQLIYDGYWACLRAPLNCDTSWLVPESGSERCDEQTRCRHWSTVAGTSVRRIPATTSSSRSRSVPTARQPKWCRVGGRPACCTAHRSTQAVPSVRTIQQPWSTTPRTAARQLDRLQLRGRALAGRRVPTTSDEGSDTNACPARAVVALRSLLRRRSSASRRDGSRPGRRWRPCVAGGGHDGPSPPGPGAGAGG